MKHFKMFVSTLLTFALLLSMSATAFAAETSADSTFSPISEESEVMPRAIWGYCCADFTANGPTKKTFTITVDIPAFNWTASQFTVKTSGFKADSFITLNILNPSGQAIISTYSITGNKELKNQGLRQKLKNGTYTIIVEAFDSSFLKSDTGRVEVWLY